MIFHVFGLSGVGKTTLANNIKLRLEKEYHTKVMILDGDKFRENISSDLGFSKNDREENIRRMFEYAKLSSANNIITIVSAISPYNAIRTAYKKN
ncbi:MAG: adenylyl-sulfate kinase [Bacteroidia bacterium]|nr:adenylyl-sulfate kinase [Bacteroidia bacterium]